MPIYISDNFTKSLGKLTNVEQKATKTTAMDLQLYGFQPGDRFHRIDHSKDTDFWSLRVNNDLRIIVHKREDNLLLCHVDHHDKAYAWAAKRKLEAHPKTGALQLVEVREKVEERTPVAKGPTARQRQPLKRYNEDQLLEYGVPLEWIPAVQDSTEDSLLELADHLPAEAMEAILALAVGAEPQKPAQPVKNVYAHPDAQRRFRLIGNAKELDLALDFPWEKWAVFLHPEQRKIVEADYAKPARVCGSAGTGKSIVAVHRAFRLAQKNPKSRVFLTTFSDSLAKSLKEKLRILCESDPSVFERIDVRALDQLGQGLYKGRVGKEKIATRNEIVSAVLGAYDQAPNIPYPPEFILNEWDHVLDAWQFPELKEYLGFSRSGTKKKLGEEKRRQIWEIYQTALRKLNDQGLITLSAMYTRLAGMLKPETSPYEFVVVDEAQDLSVAQLKFLAALGGNEKNRLFFAGDSGQQIFQRPFAWKDVGLDIRGRSKILKVNYRTSHQIRRQADLLLNEELDDGQGEKENRRDVVSVFEGPGPIISCFDSIHAENVALSEWIKDRLGEGITSKEIALVVRGEGQFERAKQAIESANCTVVNLDKGDSESSEGIRLASMHEAKGLEYRVVAVMGCDDSVIPDLSRVEELGDYADLDVILEKERHLLYVACTRARDYLWVSGVKPVSEFIKDIITPVMK